MIQQQHYIGQQVDTRHGRGTIVTRDYFLVPTGGFQYLNRWGVLNDLDNLIDGDFKYYHPNEMTPTEEGEPVG